MSKDKTVGGRRDGVELNFTREEANLILEILQQTWKTPLGSRQNAVLLGKCQDKFEVVLGNPASL